MEEGEIIDEEIDYHPLKRPDDLHPGPQIANSILSNLSEPSAEESNDDEDSDDCLKSVKKQKLKLKAPVSSQSDKLKKYNIWSSGLQEEVLTQGLTNCEVEQRYEKNRDVESYDYTLNKRDHVYEDSREQRSNKRHFDDQRRPMKQRLGRRNSDTKEPLRGPARLILDLVVSLNDTEEDISKDMANKLCEEKEDLVCMNLDYLLDLPL